MQDITHHSFSVELATKYGLNDAILLQHIAHWIKVNSTNNVNINDGECWTYITRRGFQEVFPYISEKCIRGALKRLEDLKIIKSGSYNKSAFDRTKWYTIVDQNIKNLFGIRPVLRASVNGPEGQCQRPSGPDYTRYKTDIKKDIEEKDVVTSLDESKKTSSKNLECSDFGVVAEKQKVLVYTQSQYALAVDLKNFVRQSGTSAIIKESNIRQWANEFRKMQEIDKRTEPEIRTMISNVFQDDFWSKNIRSAGTLRKQWNAGKLDRLNRIKKTDISTRMRERCKRWVEES